MLRFISSLVNQLYLDKADSLKQSIDRHKMDSGDPVPVTIVPRHSHMESIMIYRWEAHARFGDSSVVLGSESMAESIFYYTGGLHARNNLVDRLGTLTKPISDEGLKIIDKYTV